MASSVPTLSDAQQARFEAERAAQIIERSRWGSAVGMLFCVALAFAFPRQFPGAPFWESTVPPLVAALTCAGAIAVSYVAWVKARPALLIGIIGNVIAVCVGVAASVSGGFRSHIGYSLMLLWMYSTAVVPLRLRWFIAFLCSGVAIVYAIILWRTADPGPPGVLTMTLVGGAALCIAGALLRDRAAERTFLAREELDALNTSLAERVQEQVQQIVERAREVELLNDQLRERVQERSRELAAALRQLGRVHGEGDGRLAAGETVGRVRITRLLGEGGMGSVYAGVDLLTGREVALKVLRPGVADATALQRFVGEAAAAAAISHPAVIKTIHVDVSSDGRLYQIMELVEGPTLERRMTRGGLTPGEAARVGAAIAAALAAAHDKEIVHRDIKPNNIILASSPPGVRLLDFGLSKMRAASEEAATAATAAQALLGTPAYMSPEQIQDAASVGPATDVYSLGVVLYRLVGGRLPFEAKSVASLLRAHVHEAPPSLATIAPSVPAELAATIERCLAKDPAQRPTAAQLALALEAAADASRAEPLALICAKKLATDEDATGPTLAGAQ